MSFGLVVYDEYGVEVFNTDRLTAHRIGVHTIQTRSGSIDVPGDYGEVWAALPTNFDFELASVWVDGQKVRWQLNFAQVSDGIAFQYGRYSK